MIICVAGTPAKDGQEDFATIIITRDAMLNFHLHWPDRIVARTVTAKAASLTWVRTAFRQMRYGLGARAVHRSVRGVRGANRHSNGRPALGRTTAMAVNVKNSHVRRQSIASTQRVEGHVSITATQGRRDQSRATPCPPKAVACIRCPPGRDTGGMTGSIRNRSGSDIGHPRDAPGVRYPGPPYPRETRAGVQVNRHHGIWQVRVDGVFLGDYHQEEHARAAAALFRRSPP